VKLLRGPRAQRGLILLSALVLSALAAAAVGTLVLAFMAVWYWNDLPTLDKATAYRPRQHLQVLTADGAEIAQFGTERRVFVPIAQAPKLLKDAVLAVEDHDFYNHHGISFKGMARAALSHATGGIGGGASTITQQVSRTFFLSTRRTLERKIKEGLIALQLESELGKDGILELYLNQIYLGQRAYGYGAAAQVYFGKPLAQLNLAETAMLAGLQQNPIYANPIVNNAAATKRQHWVLHRMVVTGAITEAQRNEAVATKLAYRKPSFVDVPAQHVAEMARRAVVERLGEKAYTEGVRVFTSIRSDEQRVAHAALRRAVIAHERKQAWRGPEGQEKLPDDAEAAERAAALALKDESDDEDLRVAIVMSAGPTAVTAKLASGENITIKGEALRRLQPALAPKAEATLAIRRGAVLRVQLVPRGKVSEWQIVQWPQAEAAFVALDPATGRVRALVGGFDFNRQNFNHVTQAWRQPGSASSPSVFGRAGARPDARHRGGRRALRGCQRLGAGQLGQLPAPSTARCRVRDGLARSRNLVSVRVLQQVGLGAARDWARPLRARPGAPAGRPDPGPGHRQRHADADGAGLWRHRQRRLGGQPVLIERIVDAQGKVLFEAPPATAQDEASASMPERNVFLMSTACWPRSRAAAPPRVRRPRCSAPTCTARPAPPTTRSTPGSPASSPAWSRWRGWATTTRAAWASANRAAAWRCRSGSITWPRCSRACRCSASRRTAWSPPDWRYAEWAEQAPIERIEADAATGR
jgi:penicillin-binding protein 1A